MQNLLIDHLPTAEVDRQTMAAAAAMVCLGRGSSSWSPWSMVVDDGGRSLRIVRKYLYYLFLRYIYYVPNFVGGWRSKNRPSAEPPDPLSLYLPKIFTILCEKQRSRYYPTCVPELTNSARTYSGRTLHRSRVHTRYYHIPR